MTLNDAASNGQFRCRIAGLFSPQIRTPVAAAGSRGSCGNDRWPAVLDSESAAGGSARVFAFFCPTSCKRCRWYAGILCKECRWQCTTAVV